MVEKYPTENFILTTLFESIDDLDKNIMDKTMSMIMGLQLENFLLTEKVLFEAYFGHIKDMAESLFKANSHRRKYFAQKEQILNAFKQKNINYTNNANVASHSVELDTEIDGFLTHIKAALDSLAKTLNPLFGFKLHGWHKEKKESGRQVVNKLQNNLPDVLKNKAQMLIDVIEKNISWISYLVFLRDSPNHYGGLKNISDITFRQETKEVVPQYIFHNKNIGEEVGIFLTRSINEITEFVHLVLVFSLLTKSSDQLVIVKNEKDEFPPFRWAITSV